MNTDPPQHMAPSPNFSQPLVSAAPEAQPSTYAAIVQKYSRLYLVRLCTVGPLIVLHIVGAVILLLAFMNDVQSYSNSKYSDDFCDRRNTIYISVVSFLSYFGMEICKK